MERYAVVLVSGLNICRGFELDDDKAPIADELVRSWGVNWAHDAPGLVSAVGAADGLSWYLAAMAVHSMVEQLEKPHKPDFPIQMALLAISRHRKMPFMRVFGKYEPGGLKTDIGSLGVGTIREAKIVEEEIRKNLEARPKVFDGGHRRII